MEIKKSFNAESVPRMNIVIPQAVIAGGFIYEYKNPVASQKTNNSQETNKNFYQR